MLTSAVHPARFIPRKLFKPLPRLFFSGLAGGPRSHFTSLSPNSRSERRSSTALIASPGCHTHLFSRTRTTMAGRIDLGLERIHSLLARLGHPETCAPVIHVAGTNGKGSTTAYLDSLLRACGIRTGRFNSPHLVEPRDCVRIDGNVVDQTLWELACEQVRRTEAGTGSVETSTTAQSDAGEREGPLGATTFEILTATAFHCFALAPPATRPEILLIEVGVGGRLDATNVFPASHVLASVICPVALDHEALLGSSLRAIASEKAGIIKDGGLCVLADQRRFDSTQASPSEEVDVSSLSVAHLERAQLGEEAAEIVDAVREIGLQHGARLVKGWAPWQALSSDPSSSASSTSRTSSKWAATTSAALRYSPTLFPPASSSSFRPPGTYTARPGDSALSAPRIRLSSTRTALAGASTALQTLWSIARDTPREGLPGADPHEELRLRLAWAMRDEADARAMIGGAIENTRWEGRCDFVDVRIALAEDTNADAHMQEGEEGEIPNHGSTSTTLQLLVDGAHNPASAQALRSYVDACISVRTLAHSVPRPRTVRITWLLAFSAGKDVRGMLDALLRRSSPSSSAQGGVEQQMADLTLRSTGELHPQPQIRIEQRVACLPFKTPVEGMTWVQALDPNVAADAAREALGSGSAPSTGAGGQAQVQTFDSLVDALRWAAKPSSPDSVMTAGEGVGAEKAAEAKGEDEELVVLCGSLYLVGELYGLVRGQS